MGGSRGLLGTTARRWWLAAFVVATLWVWQRYAVVQAGHRVAERRASLADLIETRDALRAENTTLSARVRIESIAIERLGLRATMDGQVIRLPEMSAPVSQPVIGTSPAPAETEHSGESGGTLPAHDNGGTSP